MSASSELVALIRKHQPITGPQFDKIKPKSCPQNGSIKLSDMWRSKYLSRLPIEKIGSGPAYAYAAPEYPGGVMYGGKQLPAVVPKPPKPKPSKIPDEVQPYPGTSNRIVVEIGGKRLIIEDL
jgi:hypothetical protein